VDFVPPEVAREMESTREKAAEHLKAKYEAKALEVIDSIKPVDLESGRLPVKNAKGEVTGYRAYGPSLSQKAIAAGIMADKVKMLGEYSQALSNDHDTGRVVIPDTVDALMDGIRREVKSIKALQIDFADSSPKLARETQDILAEAELVQAVNAEEVAMEDFDGNSVPE
jgi:hypothetical protein